MTVSPTLQQLDRTYVRYRGRKLSYFAGCDYFRLASHPKVLKAAATGLKKYGLNVAASRLTTGNHELYEQLEESLVDFFGAETATLASNGYAPNLIVAQTLAGQYSHALIDERSHGSLLDAAGMLDCPTIKFKHRDPNDLTRILKRLGKVKPIVLTDGMFSHNGEIAPLRKYLAVLPSGGGLLLDDAHGAGTLGKTGRGTPEQAGVSARRIIQTVTLSKAFGVYGGAVLGPRELREAIVARSRIFVGNTPLPLPLANAAITSIALLKADRNLRKRLINNTTFVKSALARHGFSVVKSPSPIIPFIPETAEQAAELKRRLLAAGIHPPFIKYPGGPESGYFRFVISSEHTPRQLTALVNVLVNKYHLPANAR
jgi:7-keto-8-aminopelargonate synthetase-like enzyme